MKENKQFDYSFREYKSNPLPIITEFVNHNHDLYFDFVIFLNNPQKFQTQKKECHAFKYIKLLFANIGFCNYAYLDGYDYKVISKLPNEIDERKYLDKFYKMDMEEIKASIGMGKDNSDELNNNNKINDFKDAETEPMHSEIYGVNKGHVYEKSTPSKNTTTSKIETKKVETKKTSAPTKGSNAGKKM